MTDNTVVMPIVCGLMKCLTKPEIEASVEWLKRYSAISGNIDFVVSLKDSKGHFSCPDCLTYVLDEAERAGFEYIWIKMYK